jgi:hypothetical protein
MVSQRVISTGIASLALGLLGLAVWHVQYPNHLSELFQVCQLLFQSAFSFSQIVQL